jgi:hypothetical protein
LPTQKKTAETKPTAAADKVNVSCSVMLTANVN